MQTWSGFYSVIGAVAATLTGLLFVAVSMNVVAIFDRAHGHSRRLAEQAFQNYLAVLLVSLLALFPSMSLAELGFVTLCVTATWAVWVLVRLYLSISRRDKAEAPWRSMRRHISSLVGFGMLVFAASRMALNVGDSRNLFAIATIVLLFSAAQVSWELLIRIGELKQAVPED
jgi:hypothetical protein